MERPRRERQWQSVTARWSLASAPARCFDRPNPQPRGESVQHLRVQCAAQLLSVLTLTSGCGQTLDQNRNQAQQAVDIDTQRDNAAFQTIHDNCKELMKNHALDPIRDKVDLMGAVTVNNSPPALSILTNTNIPTADEKTALIKWTEITDECNTQIYNYELAPYDPSTINAEMRDKVIYMGKWDDQQIRTLATALHHEEINYSQFAKKQQTINNIFSAAQQMIGDNEELTARQAIDEASAQASALDSVEGFQVGNRNEVKLENHGGIYTLPVLVNGKITLDFVLDSGASNVQIPLDVFTTLIRTGTVSEKDLMGKETANLADGSQVTTYSFTLRELKVGGHVVTNVVASVSRE
jgi:predicted aspartyl protease